MLESRAVPRSAVKAKRGTKQTCRNETCGSPYYDLERAPPACPYCGAFCDTPATIRIDFDTLGKQKLPKFGRRVQPSRPLPEPSKIDDNDVEIVDEQAEKDGALPSTAEDLLIEIEDDDEVEAPVESAGEMS